MDKVQISARFARRQTLCNQLFVLVRFGSNFYFRNTLRANARLNQSPSPGLSLWAHATRRDSPARSHSAVKTGQGITLFQRIRIDFYPVGAKLGMGVLPFGSTPDRVEHDYSERFYQSSRLSVITQFLKNFLRLFFILLTAPTIKYTLGISVFHFFLSGE